MSTSFQHHIVIAAFVALTAACGGTDADLTIPTGSAVSVEKRDGVVIAGRLVDVQPQHVVVETAAGQRMTVDRAQIGKMSVAAAPAADAAPAAAPAASRDEKPKPGAIAKLFSKEPEYREVTIPAGTVLPVELQSAVGSDTSTVEDTVRARLRRAITVDGIEAIPAGSTVLGTVTAVERAGRVKGRARVAFRFHSLTPANDSERLEIRTAAIAREAQGTKKNDAVKIGGGAGAGAVIGGLLGGGSGAAKGAAIGGGAGTAVVLGTRGEEVRIGPGAAFPVKLTKPLTVRVPSRPS
ncbi:MAG: TrbI/VirB10 family protein [Acidobacteria bacterium]|nr:TrbI/VirB10 family protein [Acidobacteriota bacterium]